MAVLVSLANARSTRSARMAAAEQAHAGQVTAERTVTEPAPAEQVARPVAQLPVRQPAPAYPLPYRRPVPRRSGAHRLRRVRQVGYADGRRPARLAGAPLRTVLRCCAARPVAGSLGWLVLAAALTFLVVVGIGWVAGGQADASVPQHTVVVQVRPGDTLWSVAQRSAPSAGTAAMVDRIRALNGLPSNAALYPGEQLEVPAG
jgi:hypothetical protein